MEVYRKTTATDVTINKSLATQMNINYGCIEVGYTDSWPFHLAKGTDKRN
jgi:hypothetical protein